MRFTPWIVSERVPDYSTLENLVRSPRFAELRDGAMAEALTAFFGSDKVSFSLDSRVTHTIRQYGSFHAVVKDVNEARVLAGFHFRNSDQQGAHVGRNVARFVAASLFHPTDGSVGLRSQAEHLLRLVNHHHGHESKQ